MNTRGYTYSEAIGQLKQFKSVLTANISIYSSNKNDNAAGCRDQLDRLNQSLEVDQLNWSNLNVAADAHWIVRTLLTTLASAQAELQDSISCFYRSLDSINKKCDGDHVRCCAELVAKIEQLCQQTESVRSLQHQLVQPLAELQCFDMEQNHSHFSSSIH